MPIAHQSHSPSDGIIARSVCSPPHVSRRSPDDHTNTASARRGSCKAPYESHLSRQAPKEKGGGGQHYCPVIDGKLATLLSNHARDGEVLTYGEYGTETGSGYVRFTIPCFRRSLTTSLT